MEHKQGTKVHFTLTYIYLKMHYLLRYRSQTLVKHAEEEGGEKTDRIRESKRTGALQLYPGEIIYVNKT